jgi:ALG6, ALG8 glycosyltransferase family
MAGVSLPNAPASVCAMLLLLTLLPGLYGGAWRAAAEQDNQRLVLAVVYSAISSFLLGFHVHETSILNAIIPMIFRVCTPGDRKDDKRMPVLRILFFQMTALGLLGLFPMLFRSAESPLKLVSYVGYMSFSYHVLLNKRIQSLGGGYCR